jgi:hypothetical protein
MTSGHGNHIPYSGFETEQDVMDLYTTRVKNKAKVAKLPAIEKKHWYQEDPKVDATYGVDKVLYGHHERIQGGALTCEPATDEWYRWFITTPISQNPMVNPGDSMATPGTYGNNSAFLLHVGNSSVYLTTATPYVEDTDVKRVIMTERAALLVPVYNVFASPELFPTAPSAADCERIIKDDLVEIIDIAAKFDGKEIYGCCVLRTKVPITISNVPKDNIFGIPEHRMHKDNSIDVYHGGFWLLVREDKLTKGDHLLTFAANSVNYEIKAKISILSLV